MARDVRRFVQGCPDCAISKSPRHIPAGKILPLPMPNRPWSHLGVDFITDLPVSDGNTCIFVIIDRFSKFCHLIPLAGLPTAMQTAELIFNQVVHYYGIPEDGQRPTIHFPSLESLLLTPRCDRKPLLRVSSAVEWADRAQNPGCGTLPANLLPWPQKLLEPVPWLSRVCPEFPLSELDWTHSLPVRTRFPASPVSMVRGTIRRPHGRLLVTRERGSLGCYSPSATAGSAQTEDSSGCPTISQSRIPTWAKGLAVHTRHGLAHCACLAGSSVPDSLAPSPFWNKLTLSLTNFSYPHTTGFTQPSTYHCLNPSLHLFPQSLARQRSTLSLFSKTKEPSTALRTS